MNPIAAWFLFLALTLGTLAAIWIFVRLKWPDWLKKNTATAVAFAILFMTLGLGFPTEAAISSLIGPTDPTESSATGESTPPEVEEASTPPAPTGQPEDVPPTEASSSPTEEDAPSLNESEEIPPSGPDDGGTWEGSSSGRDSSTEITVDIEIDDNSKMGIETWKAVHNMRVSANIFDQYGEIEEDCFAGVEVARGEDVLYTTQGKCTTSFGLATRQYGAGEITITFNIETSWGATGTADRTITIITD